MTLRKLFKTPTAGGKVFWTDVAKENGWRIQYNSTLDNFSPLKPYRLLDSEDYLVASADNREDIASAIPELVDEYNQKKPLLSNEEVEYIIKRLIMKVVK